MRKDSKSWKCIDVEIRTKPKTGWASRRLQRPFSRFPKFLQGLSRPSLTDQLLELLYFQLKPSRCDGVNESCEMFVQITEGTLNTSSNYLA